MLNPELIDLVGANTRKTAFRKWSIEDVREKMNILHVGKDHGRDIYIYKDSSYTGGHPGYIFFALCGSPQKMSAVYNYNNMSMTFLTSYGKVKEIWSNVCITGIKDLPDRCSIHADGRVIDTEKYEDMDTEKYEEFDESNFHNYEDNKEDIKAEYERKIEELLYLRNEEKIILFQHSKDNYYTNEITIYEYGDTHIWMCVNCGNYKLKEEIVNKILEINKKYEQFAEHSFHLSPWGFTTFSIEKSKYNDFKKEIEELILDMDNYLHDTETQMKNKK